ncbi:universal stress protein [Nonomuraea maheshkhaliensis]|uniref:Universal stress protein n=1 Tax=Nonomuraea maheshkhaliensis TaxID=419590 RepID=A0ABN2I0D1_9ACTN
MERIIVGFDGSQGAAAALGWALGQARLHHADLLVWTVLPEQTAAATENAVVLDDLRRTVRDITHSAAEMRVTRGHPAAELAAACTDTDLLVLGSRGRSPLTGLLLGSVSRGCLHQAPCPVTIVPDRPRPARPYGRVIVALDGSPSSRLAVRLAAEEAALRGAELHAVHAVYWDPLGAELLAPDAGDLVAWGERLLAGELAELQVQARPVVVPGHPAEALTRLGAQADLLVMGRRGRSRLTGILLGSTSDYCAQHALCPVMVAPAT